MKIIEDIRSHSPFEALLAVSGNLDESQATRCSGRPLRPGTGQCRGDYSSTDLSELDSADNTALGGAYAEGVGTSGCGDSGDTEFQSESSRDIQGGGSEKKSGREAAESSRSGSASAKKLRMVWTIELHKRFLNAVNHLGMENAVPKVILKMMNVDGMTRENVASHLQKYRLHLKHQASGHGQRSIGMQSVEGSLLDANPANPTAKGLPIPQSGSMAPGLQPAAGGTALGLPLSLPLAPYQMAGSLLTGAPCEHIPPQAWAAGVPGYDALQKLERIPEEQKAALLKDLTAPRPMPEGFHTRRGRQQKFQTPTLDIAPLKTSPPQSMPAQPGPPGE